MNYQFQFQFQDIFAAWPLLLQGTWITIQLSLTATVLDLAVAIVCAWAKTSGPQPLRWAVNAYIELIRNTPFLVQQFFTQPRDARTRNFLGQILSSHHHPGAA